MYSHDIQDGKIIESCTTNIEAFKRQNEQKRELIDRGRNVLKKDFRLVASIDPANYLEYCKNAGIPTERMFRMTPDEKQAMLKHFQGPEYRVMQF